MHTPLNGRKVSWEQLVLEPPHVIEITLKVGIIPVEEHTQLQIEVRDATRGELIALSSWPHVHPSDLSARYRDACSEVERLADLYSGPF